MIRVKDRDGLIINFPFADCEEIMMMACGKGWQRPPRRHIVSLQFSGFLLSDQEEDSALYWNDNDLGWTVNLARW